MPLPAASSCKHVPASCFRGVDRLQVWCRENSVSARTPEPPPEGASKQWPAWAMTSAAGLSEELFDTPPGRTQLGIRLNEDASMSLALLQGWIRNQRVIEFLGLKESGPAVAETPTRLARYILDAGVRALTADMRTDIWINEAAVLFNSNYSPNGVRQALLELGVPPKVVDDILVIGWQKFQKQGDRELLDVDGETLSARLHERYSNQLLDQDMILYELQSLQETRSFEG
jgi:hypothetical protein